MRFSFSISKLLELLGNDVEVSGDYEDSISGLASLKEAQVGDLSFLGNSKYASEVAGSSASVLLLPRDYEGPGKPGQLQIRLDNPSLGLALVCREVELLLHPMPTPGIHPSAIIEPGAEVSAQASIGAFCYIGEGAKVGAAQLQNHVSIGKHAEVGDGSILFARCVVADYCRVGLRNRISQGAVLGSDGYGYTFHEGSHERLPQIGRVVTGPDVDVGANTTIDRARFGETVIGEGTKIDNLVQIAHNVKIGRHCLIVAQVGISGSTEFSDGVVAGGQSGFLGHLKVGAGAMIAATSLVSKSVEEGTKLKGNPAIPIHLSLRLAALQRKLPEFFKRIEHLEKYIESK